ncbi:hypothetical protein MYCTH_2306032 [Thermothelomyces thermophilus ATCC 42464]|uniref:Uncharacterized protein n=1 Tax=Thermothelomyces thermophilus (strain ATCC 42464 / BCRC 31852 / DSM 1799) TaxID=573729 RepID=G2QGM4_THET4|nr:uncharacterized protein MYCTH_2306032 [Thermothelomyces thermophilus ATCC 42464]AEO58586.1 hypothetical protein MYCTH_2306032 [Thermothelomyces thermophilus ATCC 42464]
MGGMAWGFNIGKKRDPQHAGRELAVHWNDYTPLLIAKPSIFPFEATPRSPEKAGRMRAMYGASVAAGRLPRDMDLGQFRDELGDQVYCDVDDDLMRCEQEEEREEEEAGKARDVPAVGGGEQDEHNGEMKEAEVMGREETGEVEESGENDKAGDVDLSEPRFSPKFQRHSPSCSGRERPSPIRFVEVAPDVGGENW